MTVEPRSLRVACDRLRRLLVAGTIAAALVASLPSPASIVSAAPQGSSGSSPALAPGSLEHAVANQPDFAADFVLALASPDLRIRTEGRMTRKGDRRRADFTGPIAGALGLQHAVTIERPGHPTVVLDEARKVYFEIQVSALPAGPAAGERLLRGPGLKATRVGEGRFDGRAVERFRVTKEGEEREIYVDVARELKNLIVHIEGRYGVTTFFMDLTNVSLAPADELFEIPPGYTKVSGPGR